MMLIANDMLNRMHDFIINADSADGLNSISSSPV